MIKTQAIRLKNPEPMMVTWDIGRRCNYDCTYCPAMRHDTTSNFHKLKELTDTFEFIKKWTDIYNKNRTIDLGYTNIDFTGGEPTINPDFFDLLEQINQEKHKYRLSLTTNGTWGEDKRIKILDYFSGVTISYHAEAKNSLKNRVIDNILHLNKNDIHLQVNLMLHVDYWDECVDVYNYLRKHNIDVKPCPIGDEDQTKGKWFVDEDRTFRRTSHIYSKKQQEWFFNVMSATNESCSYKSGDELGRSCCGGRCISGLVNNSWQDVNLIDTHFKDWFCTIDWYFLHIEQHTGLVYHHQTCQALHDNKRGSLGHLSQSKKLLDDLSKKMLTPKPIVCPNNICGCGMCVPKAESASVFQELWNNIK